MFAVALNSIQLNSVVFIWSVGLFDQIHCPTRFSLECNPYLLATVSYLPVVVCITTLNLKSVKIPYLASYVNLPWIHQMLIYFESSRFMFTAANEMNLCKN